MTSRNEAIPAELGVGPLQHVRKLRNRSWRFFYVSDADVQRGPYPERGWYFDALEDDPTWLNNGENGPYADLDAAIADARIADRHVEEW